jgi:hypothetical protein
MIRTTGSRVVYENKWVRLREDAIVQPDGTEELYSVLERRDFACVVPLDGDVVHLVGQWRHPVGAFSWEFPQGGWPGEPQGDAQALARLELAEETGLRADELRPLGRLWHNVGSSPQAFDVFLATGLTQGETAREASEQTMRSRTVTTAELEDMIRGGEVRDDATVAAWGLYRLSR